MGKINNWRIFLRINLLKMSCGKRWKCHFRDPKFQNFLEEHAPRPLSLGHPFGSTTFSPSCVHAQNLTLRPWFIFHDVYKKQGRSSSKWDYKVQKTNVRPENILTHAHLWLESTQIEYSSQEMAQQVWNIELHWKTQLQFKRFFLSCPIVRHYRLIQLSSNIMVIFVYAEQVMIKDNVYWVNNIFFRI